MTYRETYFDGGNGWRLGELLSEEEVKERYPDANSRNDDGLLEGDEEGMCLLVPVEAAKPQVPEGEEGFKIVPALLKIGKTMGNLGEMAVKPEGEDWTKIKVVE